MTSTPSAVTLNQRSVEECQCVWWSYRTGLEKCLIFSWSFVSLLFFGLCVTVISMAVISHNSKSKVCLSIQCISEASRIMNYINESVSPCQSFYKFACGKWLSSTPIDDQSNSVSTFSINQLKLDQRLRFLLEQPILPIDTTVEINMKNMYKSCMNLTLINEIGSKPLLEYLERLGGWPVVEGQRWTESKFDLIDFVSMIRNYGFKNDFLFRVNVAHNYKHNSEFSIYLREPVFEYLSREELIRQNSHKLEDYLDFMVDIASLFDVNETESRQELRDVVRLEMLIAKSVKDSSGYQFIKINELNRLAPNRWTDLINAYLSMDSEVNANETIITSSVDTLIALSNLINEYSVENKRVLANFMVWKIISQSIVALDKNFQEIYDDFYLRTRTLKKNRRRWKTCLSLVSDSMRTGLTSLYLINDDHKQVKRKIATEMFDNIRNKLLEKFHRNDWMDGDTKYYAINKLKAIIKFIAFSDELLDTNLVNKMHESMKALKRNDFFDNLLKVQKWISDKEYSKLRTINDRNSWYNVVTNTLINSYYSQYLNGIKIPIWILDGSFFHYQRPQYLNYGSLGWIIGHEMIHPFDNIGGQFDKRGNLRDWWDVETKILFNNKSNCFAKQYPKYESNEAKERSRLSENIADNGGIDIAFQSYQELVRQNGKEHPLPALDYTPEQLFWISAAQTWCSKLSPNGRKYFLKNSIHSLSEHRVDISFSNSPEFSKIFKCNERDAINAKNKCTIW